MTLIPKPPTCRGCPLYEPPYGKSYGFSFVDGEGNGGVLMVGEALGETEEQFGKAFIGKAGQYLFTNLGRAGMERNDFWLYNVVACRPPNNHLAGASYCQSAIDHCAPNLDGVIADCKAKAEANGKHFTILTLGKTAFMRVTGLDFRDPIMKVDHLCYPFWSDKYQAWVVGADHPSHLMRGQHAKVPILQFAARRALDIATDGLTYHRPDYLCDPAPETFAAWVQEYENVWSQDPANVYLSFDIETPYKQGKNEEEIAGDEEGDDYVILRCSFSYKPNQAVSVPWRAEYMPYIEELFSLPSTKIGWNVDVYDKIRVMAQMPIHGDILDAMTAWHILNSSLNKGLGFVAPFYAKDIPVWKHSSKDNPARYNAMDADIALRCFLGIKQDLIKHNLWSVYETHVVKLNQVLSYMSEKGMKLDQEMRKEAEERLTKILDEIEVKMEDTIPKEARKYKVYKKTPKILDGLVQLEVQDKVKRCSICGVENPRKAHFKEAGPKKKALGLDSACEAGEIVVRDEQVLRWARPLEFKISKKSLSTYQQVLKHQAIKSRKEKKVTFDESAILKLMKKYPKDALYPIILDYRKVQKLLSTYVGVTGPDGRMQGGMPVGRDGRIHTTYTHNPSTLRLASQKPNLQQLPRSGKADDLESIIRNLIVAEDGSLLTARDYSGIEAVLVGYFAQAPKYIRLAKIDVHTYYTAYALHELDGRVKAADLPSIEWDDDRLASHLEALKKEFKYDRNTLYKHLVHGANFYQGSMGARDKIFKETGVEYPVKTISTVMEIYFTLFPEIRKWHQSLWLQAEKDGFIRNPYGYVHRFSKVFDYEKVGGKWLKSPGPDANRVVAFLPQSTAAAIIKAAMMRLFFNRFDEAGQFLRLQIHDEIMSECPMELVDRVDGIMKEEMEAPIRELPLPSSYGMGDYLTILTEGKRGLRWGSMK